MSRDPCHRPFVLLAMLVEGLTYIIAVAFAFLVGMGRAHVITTVVEQQTPEQARLLVGDAFLMVCGFLS